MSTTNAFSKARILLVDDEPFIRRTTSSVLRSLGVSEVIEAKSASDAISSLGKNEVDLLITDIAMPEMNGLELIQQIRMGETPAHRGLRTIVMTSFSFPEILSSGLLLDISGFLVKPINPANAEEKIRFALDEKLNLRPAETYLQVKTDLEAIEGNK